MTSVELIAMIAPPLLAYLLSLVDHKTQFATHHERARREEKEYTGRDRCLIPVHNIHLARKEADAVLDMEEAIALLCG